MRHIAFFRGSRGKQLFSPCFASFTQLRRVLQNPQQITVRIGGTAAPCGAIANHWALCPALKEMCLRVKIARKHTIDTLSDILHMAESVYLVETMK